ncbi:MAG: hypothetical protein K2W95_35910 [Candidatus Obscuribacterales bacterium]|nr:hypothetical protein [Candidatus Obscuribacterales bacterium]
MFSLVLLFLYALIVCTILGCCGGVLAATYFHFKQRKHKVESTYFSSFEDAASCGSLMGAIWGALLGILAGIQLLLDDNSVAICLTVPLCLLASAFAPVLCLMALRTGLAMIGIFTEVCIRMFRGQLSENCNCRRQSDQGQIDCT